MIAIAERDRIAAEFRHNIALFHDTHVEVAARSRELGRLTGADPISRAWRFPTKTNKRV